MPFVHLLRLLALPLSHVALFRQGILSSCVLHLFVAVETTVVVSVAAFAAEFLIFTDSRTF